MTSTLIQPARPARRAVSDYSQLLGTIKSAGLLQPRVRYYVTRVVALVALFTAVWVGFALLGEHWGQVAIAAVLAIVVTHMLFLSHDAAHRAIFRTHRANEWLALVLGTAFGGVSLGWWNNKHNRHHAAPNQVGKDPDIAGNVVRFYPDDAVRRNRLTAFVYSHQGWWFYPLLIVEALNLHVQSIVMVLTKKDMKYRKTEAAMLAVRLGVYPALLFTFLPWSMALAFLGVQLAVTGVYLGMAFAVSHIGMPIVAKDNKIDFLRRQVLMSRNISGGRLASALMGGLNYQIEHHLFPAMPRPSLRHARTLVRDFCARQDITYQEIGVHRAWVIVARHLNAVGIPGALAAACPTAAVMR